MRRPRPPCGRLLPAPVLALVLVAGALTGCTTDAGSAPAPTRAASAPPDVVRALERSLERRAAAVRRGDVDAFVAGLAPRPAFVREQRTWFGNLAQLPVGRFGYTLDPGTLVRHGDDYWVVVERHLQLQGYDPRPVMTPDRFRFTPGRGPGHYLLASTSDAQWERAHDVRPAPWDAGPVEVRSARGVLGVFDAASVASAAALLTSVQEAVGSVAADVPYTWSRSVVVYALSDPAFLTALADLPGDDPTRVGAIAFPVTSRPGGRVVATRVVLNPRLLFEDDAERDRLLRHEVTHVAVGTHDDRVPVWLAEGVAELVSVRPMAPQERLLPDAAVEQASAVEDLPDDATFNDEHSAEHYAVAWWACEYVADAFGEAALWDLVDAMDEDGADPDEVLQLRLGLTSQDLAEKAGRMIEATFGPPGRGGRREHA
ncbi:hypothetical protein ACT8ZV_10060 [Nocardioides sp. MAHUQ-72]|uniref:hypothetical protein n=1 Tax=unclassified Nocardioides TaxID=2615069 RepID=UPI00360A8A9E